MGVSYMCRNCNYKFVLQSERLITTCPYCGKPGTLRTLNRGPSKVNKIIDEA